MKVINRFSRWSVGAHHEGSAPGSGADPSWMPLVWLLFCGFSFALGVASAYEPSWDSGSDVVLALLPWLLIVLIAVVVLSMPLRLPAPAVLATAAGAIAVWAVLMFQNDDWSIATFAIYAVGYSSGKYPGLVLSGVISAIWAAAWIYADIPTETVMIPIGIFVVGILIWYSISRAGALTSKQAALIDELQATRVDLAASERSKGVLEERARFASEIHDTLAQGFTSIVLLSRAGKRTGATTDSLDSIEKTALENLDAARRLVDAIRPVELENAASLPDALERQLERSLPAEVNRAFQVSGQPRRLTGTAEVTLLRAAQEALLNIRNHAEATEVEVTLSYLDDVVALDVRDNGVGFVADEITDRGPLTGGQGLRVLKRRAQALSGELSIEARGSGGSVVSVQIPTGPAAAGEPPDGMPSTSRDVDQAPGPAEQVRP